MCRSSAKQYPILSTEDRSKACRKFNLREPIFFFFSLPFSSKFHYTCIPGQEK